MMIRAISIAVFSLLLAITSAGVSFAVQPDEILKDPKLEARARNLSAELRCLVCQNQSIDDSDAPLAKDLRVLVRERLTAGDTDKQVMDFIVARYGEYVLLKPRFAPHTYLLWFSPLIFLFLGLFLVWRVFQTNRAVEKVIEQKPLSAEEEERLKKLMGKN